MDNDNIPITTFNTPKGHYECLGYIDDILLCFENEKDYEKHLNTFITLCKEHGIVISNKKVDIKKKEIEFLRMIMDFKGIRLQSHISKKITDISNELRTKEIIQNCLGCLNYSSDFKILS